MLIYSLRIIKVVQVPQTLPMFQRRCTFLLLEISSSMIEGGIYSRLVLCSLVRQGGTTCHTASSRPVPPFFSLYILVYIVYLVWKRGLLVHGACGLVVKCWTVNWKFLGSILAHSSDFSSGCIQPYPEVESFIPLYPSDDETSVWVISDKFKVFQKKYN